jgi:ankyrin repeat protein
LGVDINEKDYYGWTPLLEASRYGYDEIAEVLIK